MKHRSIMAVIFLSIITLGIYDLFWLVKVKKELNAKTTVHTPSVWLLFAPVLLMVIGIVVLIAVSASTVGSSATDTASAQAVLNIVSLLVYVVALLAVVPITFYWFFKFSKAVGQYTQGQMSTAMTFILLWLLRFIGIAVIQDHFNDMLVAGTSPQGTAPMAPMAPTPPADASGTPPAQTAEAPAVGVAPAAPGQDVSPAPTAPVDAPEDNQSSQPPTPPANPIG